MSIMEQVEIRRAYKTQESLVRYWAQQAVALSVDIEDEELVEYSDPVVAADKALLQDRRIIVIGGAKCGKSSLLGSLVSAPVIAAPTMEGDYLCWRYSCRDDDATHSRFLPLPNLDGLELVDTAPCTGAAMETCRTLLQGADVVVAVVDSREPENSPVWELLAELPSTLLSSCLLAVTFTDTLDAEHILKLKDTLRELCSGRIRTDLPVYTVTPTNENSMRIFRSRVQDVVQKAPVLRGAIRRLAERTIDLLDKQSRILRVRHSTSLLDNSFLDTIDQQIDDLLNGQLSEVVKLQNLLNESLREALIPVMMNIRDTFGYTLSPATLLRLELMGADTDRGLYHEMEENIQHVQAEIDNNFVKACSSHWGSVRPVMKKTLECEIGNFPAKELETELDALRTRLCQDLYTPFKNKGFRHRLFGIFTAQAAWMRACMIFICFLLAAGGVLGYLGQDMPGVCCVVAAVLVWVGGTLGHNIAYRKICTHISNLVDDMQKGMQEGMHSVLKHLLVSRASAYRRLYAKPRQKVARQDAMLKPLEERQKTIRIHLRSLTPRL